MRSYKTGTSKTEASSRVSEGTPKKAMRSASSKHIADVKLAGSESPVRRSPRLVK
jgi:hypothetical protein